MKHYAIGLIFFCSFIITDAQTAKYRVISIPVQKNGVWMRDPWVGGMDCPQFSVGDINQDGIPDLFVFDRAGNRVITYLGNGGAPDTMFTYAPQYERLFPGGLNNWAVLRDYNNDGIPDIFTHANEGIMVLKGTFQGGVLRFDTVSRLLLYYYFTQTTNGLQHTNIYADINDIPAMLDVNGDGDMDILVYNFYGGTISYYENQTVEHAATGAYAYDSLKYKWITSCWGNFSHNDSSNQIYIGLDSVNEACYYTDANDTEYTGALPPQGNITRHSGNSLYPIIDPFYKSVDLLNGNINYNDLMLERNCAPRSNLYGNVCEWDSLFPPSSSCPGTHPISFYSFPAAYGVNISNDSLADMLVSPNVPPPYDGGPLVAGGALNVKNVVWYKNLNDTTCWYEFQNDSFLVHHMLDFGTNSRGVFYDFDGDGLKDIIVGSYGYFNPNFLPSTYQSTLAYYRNIGTATQPAFQEITLDYDSFSNYHLLDMSPAFGDLNGDGHPDLLVGDATGYLYYFQNTATTGSSYPDMTLSHFDTLHVSAYAAPFIFDINGDSVNDILVGGDDGYIHYYQNMGTKTNPVFSQSTVNDTFGGINVCPDGGVFGCFSQPFVMKDDTGGLILYVGSERGTIFKYKINAANLNSDFVLIDSNDMGHAVGANTTISVADIYGNGKMEYLIGTSTGGLVMYSDTDIDSSTTLAINNIPVKQNQLNIYPNPARDYFICSGTDNGFVNPIVDVYNVLGQKVNVGIQLNGNNIVVNTEQLSSGFYLIRITDAGKSYPGKVLVAR